MKLPSGVLLGDRVAWALEAGQAIVALETAVATHGLPHPVNLSALAAMEQAVKQAGAVPATCLLYKGQLVIGAALHQVEEVATDPLREKASVRDIGFGVACGVSAGLTVSASLFAANLVGIKVFATGGIGGVHLRPVLPETEQPAYISSLPESEKAAYISGLPETDQGAYTSGLPETEQPAYISSLSETEQSAYISSLPETDQPAYISGLSETEQPAYLSSDDVSADLHQLANTPVVTVCSGAKSVLDIPATLELLETLRVPVYSYRTSEFPAFYLRSSGLPSRSVDSAELIGEVAKHHWALGLESAVVVGNPIPEEAALTKSEWDEWLNRAMDEMQGEGVSGKDVTPYLLDKVAEYSAGRTVEANLALLESNARLAGEVALTLAS